MCRRRFCRFCGSRPRNVGGFRVRCYGCYKSLWTKEVRHNDPLPLLFSRKVNVMHEPSKPSLLRYECSVRVRCCICTRANKQLVTICNFILGDCYNCWNINLPLLDGVVLCCYYWNICLRNFFHCIVSLALHLRYDYLYVPTMTDRM